MPHAVWEGCACRQLHLVGKCACAAHTAAARRPCSCSAQGAKHVEALRALRKHLCSNGRQQRARGSLQGFTSPRLAIAQFRTQVRASGQESALAYLKLINTSSR